MRALLMVGEGRLEMDDIAIPEVTEGSALVRTVASAAGLFHTQMVKGMLDTGGLPRILGHEIIGEIRRSEGIRFLLDEETSRTDGGRVCVTGT